MHVQGASSLLLGMIGSPLFRLPGLVVAVLLAGSCASIELSGATAEPLVQQPRWAPGQVVDVRAEELVPIEQWKKKLSDYDVILLGEEHHNRHHVYAALEILHALMQQGRHPVIAMEMFGWDGQAALDQYTQTSNGTREQFLEGVGWKQNWGGPFEDYEPLVQFAKDHGLSLIALNPPKTLVKQVVQLGLTGVRTQPDWQRWGMADELILDDMGYRDRILGQLRDCHGGGEPEEYRTMYEASLVRDEGMAKTLAGILQKIRTGTDSQAGPVVSYTGGGHIQYNLPVPKRLARRVAEGAKLVTVYFSAFEDGREPEIRDMIREGIADYVWLTPLGSQGPPRRCR
jgi:uncharacterized iron-regulated protein